jgi:hypothetical protein
MKLRFIFTYSAVLVSSVLIFGACESTSNTNVRISNANANTAIVVDATPTPTPRPLNANISRDEYDRDRSEYERERGDSTIGQGLNDSWLWFKTRAALATTADLRESTINVDVANDVITLRGSVANQAQKTRAEQVAKGIEGQKGVKNELQVRPADSMTNQMVNGNVSNTKKP